MLWTVLGVIVVVSVLFIAFIALFNRKPVRQIPSSNCIVSPADGKIVEIIDLLKINKKGGKKYSKKTSNRIKELSKGVSKSSYMIIILMSVLDVHQQRSPAEGKVIEVKHTKGKHKVTKGADALENEMAEILIESEAGKIRVAQVAGGLARSIVTDIKKGDIALKGQHIGRIKFGSHVVLVMPDYHLEVKEGDRVIGGITKIAFYGDKI